MKTNKMTTTSATSAAAQAIAAELIRIGKSNPRYDAMLTAVGPAGHSLREEVESLLIG